jgi:DNA-binding transcriptional regulator YhcF (GntR family)
MQEHQHKRIRQCRRCGTVAEERFNTIAASRGWLESEMRHLLWPQCRPSIGSRSTSDLIDCGDTAAVRRLMRCVWIDIIRMLARRQGQKLQQWLGQMVGADVRGETLRMRLDRRLATPLFRQVYQRVRDAILDGTLRPGATLPSSRSLAAHLSTARGTVELAYAVLAGEGYIVGNTTSGTMVNPGLRHFPGAGSDNELRRTIIQPHPAPDRPASARPFQMGLPALVPLHSDYDSLNVWG